MLSSASGPIQKAGKGEGLFSRSRALPYMKGEVATPKTPLPGSASGLAYLRILL